MYEYALVSESSTEKGPSIAIRLPSGDPRASGYVGKLDTLNAMAADGWELVNATEANHPHGDVQTILCLRERPRDVERGAWCTLLKSSERT